jgi:hypothetical protein
MYLIRDVFKAKPGKAKELVKKFKTAMPYFEQSEGGKNYRVMTDIAATYWTVVMESEVEDVGDFIGKLRSATMGKEVSDIMKGYMDLVDGGYREIFIIE